MARLSLRLTYTCTVMQTVLRFTFTVIFCRRGQLNIGNIRLLWLLKATYYILWLLWSDCNSRPDACLGLHLWQGIECMPVFNLVINSTVTVVYILIIYIALFVMEHHWKKTPGHVGTRTCIAASSQQTCYALDHHTSPPPKKKRYIKPRAK